MAAITAGNIIDITDILALVYPVGSIYMSVSSTSPASFIGGTWTKLTDRFLVGAGSSYSVNATGGAATVTLSTSQIPNHYHYFMALVPNYNIASGSSNYWPWLYSAGSSRASSNNYSGAINNVVGTTGGAHENRPPYLAVYMWKRTA